MHLPRRPRTASDLLLSAICILLPLLIATTLRAETKADFRSGDSIERSVERLGDLLDDLGYSFDRATGELPYVVVHQQGHIIRLDMRTPEDRLSAVLATIHYKFNPKAGTPESRALAANQFNDQNYGAKVCVHESDSSFYFEYTLQFDGRLRPRLIKTFIDDTIAISHQSVFQNKPFQRAFYGDCEDRPDTATNADEADEEDAQATRDAARKMDVEDMEPKVDDHGNDATQPATEPDADNDDTQSSPTSAEPSHTNADEARDSATSAPPASQSLRPATPPTTPAKPARGKRDRA